LIRARAGDPLRVHVVAASGEQSQVFSIDGHQWPVEPGRRGTNIVSAQAIGPTQTLTIRTRAGGPEELPGQYLYGDHRGPYLEGGLWGWLRVLPRCASAPGLDGLRGDGCRSGGVPLVPLVPLVPVGAGIL